MDIVNRNFFSILSCGAFGTGVEIEAMSQFKWEKAVAMAETLHVLQFLAKGFIANERHPGICLPEKAWNRIREAAANSSSRIIMISPHVKDKYAMPRLANAMNNMRLRRIVYNEYHSIDTSVASLNLLEIIIKNINSMMTSGVDLYGIIQLGMFLRQKGHNVDFVKTEEWLDRLGIKKMSNLLGNILIKFFGFEEDEIPFVHHMDVKACDIMKLHIENTKQNMAVSKIRHAIYGENNSRTGGRHATNGIRYIGYMPAEAICKTVSGFARRLSEIEE